MNRAKIILAMLMGLLLASPALAQDAGNPNGTRNVTDVQNTENVHNGKKWYLLVPQNPQRLAAHMASHKMTRGMSTKPIAMVIKDIYQTRRECIHGRNETAKQWRQEQTTTQKWYGVGLQNRDWFLQCRASNDPHLQISRENANVLYVMSQATYRSPVSPAAPASVQ